LLKFVLGPVVSRSGHGKMNDPGRLSDRGSLIGDRRRATNYETGCFGFAKPARMATSALVYG
jgi:hypothetical protein